MCGGLWDCALGPSCSLGSLHFRGMFVWDPWEGPGQLGADSVVAATRGTAPPRGGLQRVACGAVALGWPWRHPHANDDRALASAAASPAHLGFCFQYRIRAGGTAVRHPSPVPPMWWLSVLSRKHLGAAFSKGAGH